MQDEIGQVVGGVLPGRPLIAARRALDVLLLEFGAGGGARVELSLQVAAPWRLTDGERVLVGSGDLFTPADPDEEPESFDWEPEGASWLDVRLGELAEKRGDSGQAVTAAHADPFGGLRVDLAGGHCLEIFPNSTPTGHVSTEFWRLAWAGGDVPDLVVGTFGLERESRD